MTLEWLLTDIKWYDFIAGLIIAYLGGVMTSFTPCVYPLIPITISIIGTQDIRLKTKSFINSLVYVLGISITYTALGMIASLTGKIFGAITQHPFVYLFVGIIFVLFGLNLFGIFQLKFPTVKPLQIARSGLFSIFLMGLVSGLIIGPCLTPVIGSILVYVATRQNILYGMSLLFCFGLGLGSLLILVGTFSGIVLPKSGKWMNKIKNLLSSILILVGIYFMIKALRLL